MPSQTPFPDWQSVLSAPRSEFFRGHTSDTVFDRKFYPYLGPMTEANFTQSNARVLLGQAANGALRFIALPTQVYPAPTGEGEFGLGPGMYHHFDVVMYAGDLAYQVTLEGGAAPIDLASSQRDNVTIYADHFLPLTQSNEHGLEMGVLSYAPVARDGAAAPLSPAPLPGPAGAFYVLHLRNTGDQTLRGVVALNAGDLLVGHYEDSLPENRALAKPAVTLRQGTLILSRPEGCAGIHLHDGRWTRTEAPFQAEKTFKLEPGEEQVFVTFITLGASYSEVMPEMYNLHLIDPLVWLNHTASFWRSRLGKLAVGPGELARFGQEIYIRSLFDNFNCLQTDARGSLVSHWQGAPSHGYGTVWGIDVEPTAVSVVHICPEIARETMVFFLTRSRVPRGPVDHSTPILVAPVIIARQWLQVSGDTSYLAAHPEILTGLEGIMTELISLKAPGEPLFPSRWSSDGPVGRRYDYGTNVKMYYALDSMAYLLEKVGRAADAAPYRLLAAQMPEAIARCMAVDGPFGPQISGGTNLGEDTGDFYLREDFTYYDGEDTSSMLAPLYGASALEDPLWINYHRFARSLMCANFDPEFETLQWFPTDPAVFDGTAYVSRLGGSVTRAEMSESLQNIRDQHVDLATGSLFWWPHGDEFRRGITRCSQGQGAWAWQYLYQWLGLVIDAPSRTLSFCPRGDLGEIDWQDFNAGPHRFGVAWKEGAELHLANHNGEDWTVNVGVRAPGAGAEGELAWHTRGLAAGEALELALPAGGQAAKPGMERAQMVQREAELLGAEQGVLFRRFGPAMLWGSWDGRELWTFAPPLAIRLLVLNASGKDWRRVRVTLRPRDGWRAQARRSGHWDPPDALVESPVQVEFDPLANLYRGSAAFWGYPPESAGKIRPVNPRGSHHAPSQPGPGIHLFARGLSAALATVYTAELYAEAADGTIYQRAVEIETRIDPA